MGALVHPVRPRTAVTSLLWRFGDLAGLVYLVLLALVTLGSLLLGLPGLDLLVVPALGPRGASTTILPIRVGPFAVATHGGHVGGIGLLLGT